MADCECGRDGECAWWCGLPQSELAKVGTSMQLNSQLESDGAASRTPLPVVDESKVERVTADEWLTADAYRTLCFTFFGWGLGAALVFVVTKCCLALP